MPRKPRVFIRGGTYHVYCRATRGEAVFEDDVEAKVFIEVVRRVKERDGQRVREIAETLQKNPGSVSRWVSDAAERRSADSSSAKRLSVLDEELRSRESTVSS